MKAIIQVGGKQYIVAEKDILLVALLPEGTQELSLDALMVFDEQTAKVGTPTVPGAKVTAKVIESEVKADKIKVIRFGAKKRVKKINGHRQKHSTVEITRIIA